MKSGRRLSCYKKLSLGTIYSLSIIVYPIICGINSERLSVISVLFSRIPNPAGSPPITHEPNTGKRPPYMVGFTYSW